MHQRHRLSIAVQKITIAHIHQRQLRRVVLHLRAEPRQYRCAPVITTGTWNRAAPAADDPGEGTSAEAHPPRCWRHRRNRHHSLLRRRIAYAPPHATVPMLPAPLPARSAPGPCPSPAARPAPAARQVTGSSGTAAGRRAAQLNRLAGAGIDGPQIHCVRSGRPHNVRHHQKDNLVVRDRGDPSIQTDISRSESNSTREFPSRL